MACVGNVAKYEGGDFERSLSEGDLSTTKEVAAEEDTTAFREAALGWQQEEQNERGEGGARFENSNVENEKS
jgi:hypothetical protein